jgi:TldD protein
MIDRRRFVHSMVALGASTGLRPPLELFGAAAGGELDDLADAALASAKKLGASYADIRINRYRVQFIFTRDRRVQNIVDTQDYGFGIRVIVDGTWGFSSSSVVTKEEIARVAAQAVAIARANRGINAEAIKLAPVESYNTSWNTPVTKNPFDLPIQPKLDLLLQVHEEALKVPGASFVSAFMQFVNEDKYFASTEGSHIRQSLIRSYPSFSVTAVDKTSGKFYSRRALTAPVGMGYEYVEGYPLLAEARTAAEEAVAMHKAKTVTPGLKQLILHPTNLWLTIHESVGHPTELDRALGYEANYAGTSFLTTDKLGKFEFGSKMVNLVADKTQDRGLATCGFDDDGVKTSRWPLVKDGLFVDYQTTREQAHAIGQKTSHGCSYADNWSSIPFQRMPNVSLEPGEKDLSENDLVSATEDGVLIKGDASFSIDQQRYNFQFSGQTFWEVKKGTITTQLRDVAYQSNTTDFWRSCDLIGGRSTYELGGAFNDGKGQPSQSNAVSHGCPIARFARVNILNTGR